MLVKLSGIRNVKLAKMLTKIWPGYKDIVHGGEIKVVNLKQLSSNDERQIISHVPPGL